MMKAPKNRKGWLRRIWFMTLRALRGVALLEDDPVRIARGSAIGLFWTFQIFAGSQMFFAAIFTKLARGNVLASLPWTWITNPFTAVPIYYTAYQIGALCIPVEKRLSRVDFERWSDNSISEMLSKGWQLLKHVVVPVEIGATVIGLAAGCIGYFAMKRLATYVQHGRFLRRNHWQSKLNERLAAQADAMKHAESQQKA